MRQPSESNVSCLERAVASHYGDSGLLARLLAALEAGGADVNNLRPSDLAPLEEFHIGGRAATAYAIDKLSLRNTDSVLDVGCGIGGAARYIADRVGCQVAGIDITPEYIDCAKALTERVGLADRVRFEAGSALAMPYAAQSFDAAITLHAAMNIAERGRLYRDIARVIKTGGTLCIYDVMQQGQGRLRFPVPWAASEAISHLMTPEALLVHLQENGFRILDVENRTDFALEFFATAMAAADDTNRSPGIHLVMGDSAKEKFRNTLDGLQRGCIAPILVIAERIGNTQR